jgi:hypothetical protein
LEQVLEEDDAANCTDEPTVALLAGLLTLTLAQVDAQRRESERRRRRKFLTEPTSSELFPRGNKPHTILRGRMTSRKEFQCPKNFIFPWVLSRKVCSFLGVEATIFGSFNIGY